MIYLLPITHDVQFGKHPVLSEKFYDYLLVKIKELKTDVVCEEASDDDLSSEMNDALCKEAALECDVQYVPCDFGDDEREKNGIPTAEILANKIEAIKKSYILKTMNTGKFPQEEFDNFRKEMSSYEEIRENHWLEIIKNYNDKHVLFVVGAGHLTIHPSSRGEGFDTLLKNMNLPFTILPMDFVSRK